MEYPVCAKCSRRHAGNCMYGSGKCYKCGSADHILKNCPQKNFPTQGRVFALHAAETNPETMLMTRKIFVAGLATKALIDSGATQSLNSETFANSLKIKTIGLDIAYSVALPSGDEMTTTNVIRGIDLELHGYLAYADLIARKLMHRGCRAFLATLVSVPETAKQSASSDVPIVRDFLDVFADDVTGLPPVREVEFSIELMPGNEGQHSESRNLDHSERYISKQVRSLEFWKTTVSNGG
ncbi:uncharacterized protein [Primulina eburnea]|uniref:uncharacterized protein n=1 Tax=Primulina eburnea TaxID=1245227 RepID=UPI003C6C405B